MSEKETNVINRLEWAVGDWKETEGSVIVLDDSSDLGEKASEWEATSKSQAVLTPLDSALVSISQVFNRPVWGSPNSLITGCQRSEYPPPTNYPSHLFQPTFVTYPIGVMPENTSPDETAMAIDENDIDPQLINNSINMGMDVGRYAPEQVCGSYLEEYDRSARTRLDESDLSLLTLGVNTDQSGGVGGGGHHHSGGVGSPILSRPVQPVYQGAEVDGCAVGVANRGRESLRNSVRNSNH